METSSLSPERFLRCNCGSVGMVVSSIPVARAYCHCSSCRDFYGLAVLSATAWKSDVVSIVKGQSLVKTHQHQTKQLQRCFCLNCGTNLFGVNRLGFKVIHTSLFADSASGVAPKELMPEFRLFYAQRQLSIDDDLPKYLEGKNGPMFSGSSLLSD